MPTPLRLLLVEDRPSDAALEIAALERAGYVLDWVRVQTREEFLAQIETAPDIILADYNLPRFSGVEAIQLLSATNLNIPLIIVSGTIGEDKAVECVKLGAADYLLKDRLARLGPAIERALEEKKVRDSQSEAMNALRESEERFLQLAASIDEVFFLLEAPSGNFLYISPAFEEVWGYSSQNIRSITEFLTAIHPDDRQVSNLLSQGEFLPVAEFRIIRPDGTVRWIRAKTYPIRDAAGTLIRLAGIALDITAERRAQEAEYDQRRLAEALRDAASTLTTTLDLEEVLDRILSALGRVMPHDARSILLLKDGKASVASHAGYDERGLGSDASKISFPIADTPNLNYMAQTGRSLCIPNTNEFKGWIPTGATEWIQSWMGIPIRLGTEVLGFINLDSATPGFFTDEQTERLQAFADQAAVAVKNAQLYHELEVYSGILEQAVSERTAALHTTTRRIEAILDSIGDALLVLNLKGRIQQVNPAFVQQTGFGIQDAENQDFQHLLGLGDGSKQDFVSMLERPKPGAAWQHHARVRRKDGSLYDADFTLAPIADADGSIQYLVAVIRDITLLTEAQRAKDEFVSNVSHELRTPITGIKLNYSMLSMNPDGREVYMERIGREVERLTELIEDLLRLTRLEQGRLDLALSPVDLNEIGSRLALDRTPLAEARGLNLRFAALPDLKTVTVDSGLVEQALSVLLTNALNYTPSGGEVVIRAMQRSGEIGLSVTDSGLGILPAEQGKLFERFYRGTVGRDSGAPGTGLGLNIAKQIIERHHGTLEIASDGIPGKGSTFTMWFPMEGINDGEGNHASDR